MERAVRHASRDHLLDVDTGARGDLRRRGGPAGGRVELPAQPVHPQGQLLELARDADRPAMVSEVALDRAGDAWHGVGGEGGPTRGVKALDGSDEREAGHLLEVLERLGAALVAAGELPSERQEALDQHVAIMASPRRRNAANNSRSCVRPIDT